MSTSLVSLRPNVDRPPLSCLFFFFNDTATTEIYTLSLHDALPISGAGREPDADRARQADEACMSHRSHLAFTEQRANLVQLDRKSTRLNSSHSQISYAVFCLKKKKNQVLMGQ